MSEFCRSTVLLAACVNQESQSVPQCVVSSFLFLPGVVFDVTRKSSNCGVGFVISLSAHEFQAMFFSVRITTSRMCTLLMHVGNVPFYIV